MSRTHTLLGCALLALCILVGCNNTPSAPVNAPPYANNAHAAYWYGMTVSLRLKRCLPELRTDLEWLHSLEGYFWEHLLPESCAAIRTIAAPLQPQEGEDP